MGILFLTAAVLVLPALYLALVTAVAYLLYYHATANLSEVVAMRHWTAIVFLYVGPLIVGAILLFFMVKPLFARRSRASKVRTLEFGEEPVLFALVTRIAQAVAHPSRSTSTWIAESMPRPVSAACSALSRVETWS